MEMAQELAQKKARRRTRFIGVLLGLWAFGILSRLVELQVFRHAKLRRQVTEQSRVEVPIPADRGTITDRKGRILAQNIPSQSISYRPTPSAPVEARMAPILKIAPVLGFGPETLDEKRRLIENGQAFLFLRREVDAETARQVKEKNVRGIKIEEERRRVYPLGTLAAHVLGGVDRDEQGLAGIELRYNTALGGRPGLRAVLRDAIQREYNVETIFAPKPGKDIALTIDATIQHSAQRALEQAVADHEAEWGTIIVSVPATGEILAMASAPGYDANAYGAAGPDEQTDRSVRYLFDPGSTFKIVTAAAALEHGLVALPERFNCAADAIVVAGGPIRDHKPFGILTFADVIAQSSNIGTIQAARRLGPDIFYRTIRDFGFGERTGIDLPAEAAGIVHPPEDWSRRSLDALAVGYEVSVTAIQLLQAMNIVANRGEVVPPRLLKSVDGRPAGPNLPASAPRVISPAAAERLVSILVKAVEEGTGKAARLPGFAVAGKTGTAQLLSRDGKGFTSERHLAAFVGFVPAERPALSILVVISNSQKKDADYGGQVAAPVFRAVAGFALRYLDIHPEFDRPSAAIPTRLLGEAPQ